MQFFCIKRLLSLVCLLSTVSCFLTGDGTEPSALATAKYPLRTHKTIVTTAFTGQLNSTDITLIHRGDFLRDFSQLFNYNVLGDFVRHRLLNLVSAPADKADQDAAKLHWQDIGMYEPSQHVDNPLLWSGLHEKMSAPMEINKFNAANYIATRGKWYNSASTIQRFVMKATHLWLQYTTDRASLPARSSRRAYYMSFMYFGFTTHTLADFYAHTNFIELAIFQEYARMRYGPTVVFTRMLMTQLHSAIFPWVGSATLKQCGNSPADFCYPLVSGTFSQSFSELKASLMELWNTKLIKNIGPLDKSSNPLVAKYEKVKLKLKSIISRQLQRQVKGNHLSRWENVLLNTTGLNPTHLQLSKDYGTNPIHVLATDCATLSLKRYARLVGQFMNLKYPFNKDMVDSLRAQMAGHAWTEMVHPYHAVEGSVAQECVNLVKMFVRNPANQERLNMLSFSAATSGKNRYKL